MQPTVCVQGSRRKIYKAYKMLLIYDYKMIFRSGLSYLTSLLKQLFEKCVFKNDHKNIK